MRLENLSSCNHESHHLRPLIHPARFKHSTGQNAAPANGPEFSRFALVYATKMRSQPFGCPWISPPHPNLTSRKSCPSPGSLCQRGPLDTLLIGCDSSPQVTIWLHCRRSRGSHGSHSCHHSFPTSLEFKIFILPPYDLNNSL